MPQASVFTARTRHTLHRALELDKFQSLVRMRIVLTGSMSLSRSDMRMLIEVLGGQVQDRVTPQTTLVVIADENSISSAKYRDAQRLGITVVSEEFFATRYIQA